MEVGEEGIGRLFMGLFWSSANDFPGNNALVRHVRDCVCTV